VKASWRSPYDLACTALAVALALAVGWLDVHTTEVTVTILALLASGVLLGLLQPAAAWRWAVLLALGLPAMAAIALATGMQTAEPARLDPRIALVALAFALAGSYAGALIRATVGSLLPGPRPGRDRDARS